ncbi:hypothetical protein [uncultured Prevotella sp.]|uniref:hypothetical protein n=1 Tax=uncultured Prevotella sp. TaxID=159272 RepID=UPI00261A2BD0|nr:hypothetical protein [uncultured Prevotella sp.]
MEELELEEFSPTMLDSFHESIITPTHFLFKAPTAYHHVAWQTISLIPFYILCALIYGIYKCLKSPNADKGK